MKKILLPLLGIMTSFYLFNCVAIADTKVFKNDTEPSITIYNPDGETKDIQKSELDEWKLNGWYEAPVIYMYAPNGDIAVVAKSNIDEWKSYDFYEAPVIYMYAPNGDITVVAKSNIDEWKGYGYYEAPVIYMYAPNGDIAVVAKSNIDEWKGYGYYEAPVIYMYDLLGNITVVATSNVEEWKNYGWYDTPISAENIYVNKKGLSSQTNYLIWVSKSEFKLRVYSGSKGNWKMINSFTCTIGKNSTPTCEGTYRYYQAQKMWDYGSYYVGPIMRFNGGYAIHSTLIYKNGTPKDNRVGMKLSLGCVRLQPQDINWLSSTIPLYTTVHITG